MSSATWAVHDFTCSIKSANQDSVGSWIVDSGAIVLAVADGLGSRVRSATGSRLAIDLLGARLAEWSPPSPPHGQALAAAVDELVTGTAADWEKSLVHLEAWYEHATTFVLLVASGSWVAVGGVGDAFVFARAASGEVEVLRDAERTPEGGTAVLSARAVECHAPRVFWLPDMTSLAVFTDGVEELVRERSLSGVPGCPTWRATAPDVSRLLERFRGDPAKAREAEGALRKFQQSSQGSDDIGVAVAWR